MGAFNFTKAAIDALVPGDGQLVYKDTQVNGLALILFPSGVRSFQVRKKKGGKSIRVTLGRYPDLSIKNARDAAQKALSDIALGGNPNAQKKAQVLLDVSLGDVLAAYLAARDLAVGTVADYKKIMAWGFADWMDRPYRVIDKSKVIARHKKLAAQGKTSTNKAFRVLRAVCNFAVHEYESAAGESLFPDNPVDTLSHKRAWFKPKRKRDYLKPDQIESWMTAVDEVCTPAVRVYLYLTLFMGYRPEEGLQLRVDQLDMSNKTIQLLDTKNREDHLLPISDFIYDLFVEYLPSLQAQSLYLFPSPLSNDKPLSDPRWYVGEVRKACGFHFTRYDLRRTYITVAESLDISAYTLKRLVNHKMTGDVTGGYIVSDVERLRPPMQLICNKLLSMSGRVGVML